MIIAGVISFGPSQLIPANGFWNDSFAMSTSYWPDGTPSNLNVPSSPLSAVSTVLPFVSRSSSFTPGRPSSPCSTSPGFPPPGLKSRQTTPAIPPLTGWGCAACFASAGTSSGGIAVTPSKAVPPTLTGFAVPSVPFSEATAFEDGSALDSTPLGLTASRATAIVALIVPRSGSLLYIAARQITPAAKSEIASGANIANLNAVAQRIFSTSTAKTSPRAVTVAGTIATQTALFRIALNRTSSVNSAL